MRSLGYWFNFPLPDHINETIVIEAIDPKKDVDGFHPYTIGRLMQRIPLLETLHCNWCGYHARRNWH